MCKSCAALMLSLAVLTCAARSARAQDRGAAAAAVFHKRFFVSYQAATLRNVDVGTEPGSDPFSSGVQKVDGTGGSALGAGVSFLFSENRGLVQFGYDRAAAKFGDRTIAFHSIDMTFGYVFRWPVAVVPYFTFAPGWYRPSGTTDYTISAALGAKVGFLRYFAFNAEVRDYWEDTGGGCGTNCYYIDAPKPKDYALRTSVGLQVYFGRIGHRPK